jgi:hypothetical protein
MSRTTRNLPIHNGRTFPMRGRTRATFIAHRVQQAAAAALAYGFFWNRIPDSERRAVREARWDAYLAELEAWGKTNHKPRKVHLEPRWDRGPYWETILVYPRAPEEPSLHVRKTRRVPVSDAEAFALYLDAEAKDAALFWDRIHRDGGIDRCGRKDCSNGPDRKTQRAQARQRCREATVDGDVADGRHWQDMLGGAEVFPRKW